MLWWFRKIMWLVDQRKEDVEWAQAAVDARIIRRKLEPCGYDVVKVFDKLLCPYYEGRDTRVGYPGAFYSITDNDVSFAYGRAKMKYRYGDAARD